MDYVLQHTQGYFRHLHAHMHKNTYLYILLYMEAQEHVTSTTREELQKFGLLLASGYLMVDVPCLDHLWHRLKYFPYDGETKWYKW